MKAPLEAYREADRKDQLRKNCYQFFNDKYFKTPFTDNGFLDTFERADVKKLRFFLPGRIYTWKYDPLHKDVLDFYDKRPMVLVHSQFISKEGNMIVQGLNLNFLPEFQRVQTMQIFYDIYKDELKGAEELVNEGAIGRLRNAWKFLTDWYFTIQMFNQQGKIGYQWAYRNYIITRITQPVIIELEDWEMIPYFIPKEFDGKPPAAVWKEYIQVKGLLNKKVPNKVKSTKDKKKYLRPGQ
jgi:hypothetical protein